MVAHGHAPAACVPAKRDGEVGLAGAGRPEQDEVLVAADEFQGFDPLSSVVDGEADRGPVVAVEFLVGGESGLFQEPGAFGAFPGFEFGIHPFLHELHLGWRGVGELVGEDLAGQGQPAREVHDRFDLLAGGRAAAFHVGHDDRWAVDPHVYASFLSRVPRGCMNTCIDSIGF